MPLPLFNKLWLTVGCIERLLLTLPSLEEPLKELSNGPLAGCRLADRSLAARGVRERRGRPSDPVRVRIELQ